MATYVILVTVVLVCVVLFTLTRRSSVWTRATAIAISGILILTLVFDNIIIATGIVAYDTSKISGLYLGIAPIEDFAYSIVAVLLVGFVWSMIGDNYETH